MLIKGGCSAPCAQRLALPSTGPCLQQVFFKNLHLLFIAIPHCPHSSAYTSPSRLISEAEGGQEWVKAAPLSGTGETSSLGCVTASAAAVFLLNLSGRIQGHPQPPTPAPQPLCLLPQADKTQIQGQKRSSSGPSHPNTKCLCMCLPLCVGVGEGRSRHPAAGQLPLPVNKNM